MSEAAADVLRREIEDAIQWLPPEGVGDIPLSEGPPIIDLNDPVRRELVLDALDRLLSEFPERYYDSPNTQRLHDALRRGS